MLLSFESNSKGKIGIKFVWYNLFNSIFKLFIYFCLCWVFIAMQPCRVTFLQVRQSIRGYSLVTVRGHHLLLSRLQVALALVVAAPGLQSTGSIVEVHGLRCRGIWDLPRSGIKSVSPALAGRFFTTEPPRKPVLIVFDLKTLCSFSL